LFPIVQLIRHLTISALHVNHYLYDRSTDCQVTCWRIGPFHLFVGELRIVLIDLKVDLQSKARRAREGAASQRVAAILHFGFGRPMRNCDSEEVGDDSELGYDRSNLVGQSRKFARYRIQPLFDLVDEVLVILISGMVGNVEESQCSRKISQQVRRLMRGHPVAYITLGAGDDPLCKGRRLDKGPRVAGRYGIAIGMIAWIVRPIRHVVPQIIAVTDRCMQ
jgi:hypothetical protein